MKFITLPVHGGLVYLNVEEISSVGPKADLLKGDARVRTPQTQIVTRGGGIYTVEVTAADLFERIHETLVYAADNAERVVLTIDGTDAVDVDLEGV